ncbi:MAG: sigma-54-dependent Fis family transcriptional regulator [Burkholderiales bacterium]|nr:sigma-54-dependent Fis family transcriptional regulator [Burkholderiales bacterium]
MSVRILVIDDEEVVLRSCQRILASEQRHVDTVSDGAEGLRMVDATPYDLVVLDIKMPKMDGIEVLREIKERHPDVEVLMVTGLSEVQTAVKAMKLGAFDYLSKPFDPDELEHVVERALEHRRLTQENRDLKSEVGTKYRFENIIGTSPAMQSVFKLIAQCAPTNATVLITGESGTGKEVIARAIHYNSLRADKPFVAVDCNTFNEELFESELFGHVKGAFTGAVANKRGMFEMADGGTMFFDEFANIPLATQAKLLRVLQEREYRQVGGTTLLSTNARLIAATNKDLKAMVAEGRFREDLYYRVNVFPLQAPPLRERKADIPALAFHFLKQFCAELDKPMCEISEGAMSLLVAHDWPGNVRELENTMHRAAILAADNVVRVAHVASLLDPAQAAEHGVPRNGEELKLMKKHAREKSVEDIERRFVQEALKRNHSNVTKSAEDTGMQRANFQALMKKHNIRVRDGDSGASDTEAD